MNPNLKRLPKGWEAIVAEEYSLGATDVEVKARLKMTNNMWDSLIGDPLTSEFKEVVDFGRMLARAWWEKQGRNNLYNRQFQTNLWSTVMKNRYGYSEKTDSTVKQAGDLSGEEMDERIRKLVAKHNKVMKV